MKMISFKKQIYAIWIKQTQQTQSFMIFFFTSKFAMLKNNNNNKSDLYLRKIQISF